MSYVLCFSFYLIAKEKVAVYSKRVSKKLDGREDELRLALENKEYEFCLRCHRRLKNEEARKIGYGKVCEKKAQTEKPKLTLFKINL